MSQENVERLRQGLDAFNRRDRAAWLALCDPEYETVPSSDWPEMEPIRGPEAAWDFYVEADEPWEEVLRIEWFAERAAALEAAGLSE